MTGYLQWYKFARERKVHNVDDFQQINDDLRPFWGIRPAEIRQYAAHASDDDNHWTATVSVRDGQLIQQGWGWRSETFIRMVGSVASYLPDMDIPMNRMDQPRVVVPWEDLQEYLKIEEQTRSLKEHGVQDSFTTGMDGFFVPKPPPPHWYSQWNPFWYPRDHEPDPDDPHPPYGWFPFQWQQYMDLAAKACPPESYARNSNSSEQLEAVEALYKHDVGGFITNFNLSSDLCTVGPQLSRLHGMLYASTSTLATHKLIPMFGECKLNVNNDILFPANIYWTHDKRYEFNDKQDINWDDKDDGMPWRGVTSGGTGTDGDPNPWQTMHRQRLVQLTNSTELSGQHRQVSILALNASSSQSTYELTYFDPSTLASVHTDVGFTDTIACSPNCSIYDNVFTMLNRTTFADTFRYKYLIDVDGQSFSGRWRAFLQSRSLGIKATIFREWHDSRLFAWKHFVPLDTRYGELYSLLTYFIGHNYGPDSMIDKGENEDVVVPRHDFEAYKIAREGRERAARVLRREDIEIYMLRLLLEYGRIVDDHRDGIGIVGDGGEEMEEFDRRMPAV